MPAASHCFLHIGAPKTGTTLLQRVLFENKERLRRYGVHYPDVSIRGYGHHDLAFLIAGGYPDWATPQPRTLAELHADLSERCSSHDGSLVFSSEDFYLCPNPEGLLDFLTTAGALANREPIVIVYVRRQDEAHESWYNQTIKAQGYTHSVDDCVREFHDLWDYRKQLARWSAAFGRKAMIVRPYETAQYAGESLLVDFLTILGLPADQFSVTKERMNTGLNADVLAFQRLINELPLPVQRKRAFHHQLIELTAKTAGSGLFDEAPLFDSKRRKAILESYADGNAEVASTFLGRERLFEEAIPEDTAHVNNAGLTVEKLAIILGWLLLGDSQPHA